VTGYAGTQLIEPLYYKTKIAGSIPDGVIGPGVDWSSNRNWYQGYLLRVKAEGA